MEQMDNFRNGGKPFFAVVLLRAESKGRGNIQRWLGSPSGFPAPCSRLSYSLFH